MGVGENVDTEPLLEMSGNRTALDILPFFLIAFPILYSTYVLYDKDNISVFTGLMLLGFWILFHLAVILLVAYPIAVISERTSYSFPSFGGFSLPPFLPDLGFLIFLLLLGSLLTYVVYLRFFTWDETNQKQRDLEGLYETGLKTDSEREKVEDSLSSTLTKAIDELHDGENVRSTIIRCYKEMSNILEKSGAQNKDFKTPREFKDETIQKLPFQEDVISDITYLFEEARYSPHQLGENERDRALEHLKKLKEDLL